MHRAGEKEQAGKVMSIIVKFILKNIYEKKFRTFLILISIMLSAALFFASNAMQGTMIKMFPTG